MSSSTRGGLHSIVHRLPVPLNIWVSWVWRSLRSTVAPNKFERCHAAMGHPDTIPQGPFAGMKYLTDMSIHLLPKLIGTYELELWPCVDAIRALNPDVVIDIGAAEGFYIAGLSRLLPQTRFIGFEASRTVQYHLRKVIRMHNIASRMSVRGWCDVPALSAALDETQRPVIICDCEGAEESLLDPQSLPKLKSASILVELHDFIKPGLTELIRSRFIGSHDITTIASRERTRADAPGAANLSDEDFALATNEFRGGVMYWHWMTPKSA